MIPLQGAFIADLCDSPRLPVRLAAAIEDIGQGFITLADEVDHELTRRGRPEQEVDADLTIEAEIDALLARVTDGTLSSQAGAIEHPFSAMKEETLRRAVKIAHELSRPAGCCRSRPDP